MNVGPDSEASPESTRIPPNHSTITIITVPRNSLIGCAICWRMFTLMMSFRYWLLTLSNRLFIFVSAQKAFTMRSPPSVSSTWLMVSLQRACAFMEFCFSFLPTIPINHPITGTNTSVNSVSCHDMMIRVEK